MTNYNVCVLLSTYNGEKYLEEQLESIFKQEKVNIKLIVRDDGSVDNTISILEKYKKKYSIKIYKSNNIGPSKSFMELLKIAPKSDYYAFADQDDYWHKNKLYEAISKLEKSNSNRGKLYFSTLNIVDENMNFIKKSFITKNINLKKEMIKNYATGCTMVFDQNLLNIINKEKFDYIAMHDSLLCRIALITGSFIYVDQNSYINYRQHANNVLGMKTTFFSIMKHRFKRFVKSERLTYKSAIELSKHKNLFINEDDYNFIISITKYDKYFKVKMKMLKLRIFKKDELFDNLLYRIKLIFNKI